MSQMTWTYIADDGSRHKVGLFHGDNTGHLLIYCNASIMVIDFSVTHHPQLFFFINDELCDIEVEEKEGKFSYGFKVDQITDTPRNRVRRKTPPQGRGQAGPCGWGHSYWGHSHCVPG